MQSDPENRPEDEDEFDDMMSDEDVNDYDCPVDFADDDRIGIPDEDDDLCPA